MKLESLLQLNRTIRVIGFDDVALVLHRLTDCGKVPEALRLAHLLHLLS